MINFVPYGTLTFCKNCGEQNPYHRELTHEEIKQIFQEQTGFFFDDNPADGLALMDFARAILKKASEK